MTHTHILPFTAPEGAPAAELDTVGGKGLSLAREPQRPPAIESNRRGVTQSRDVYAV